MTIVLNPKYKHLKEFTEQIPTMFEHSGTMVYQARNQLKKFTVQGHEVIVKRYKVPHLINRFAYTFIRPSKAERAYKYALRLLDKGIHSPEPIAYIIEKKNGLITYSYFISIFESQYKDIRTLMDGSKVNEALIDELGKYTAFLHNHGVLHHDLSPGNILYLSTPNGYQFTLIDINRMEFPNKISFTKRCKSFNRLTANHQVLTKVAKAYAAGAQTDSQKTIDEILKFSDLYFNSYRVRSRK